VLCVDDGQPTALVPLTDDQEDAMESTLFQQLLRRCGLHPPASEQVTHFNFVVGLLDRLAIHLPYTAVITLTNGF